MSDDRDEVMDVLTALYRKYRPRTFDEIVGQEHITKALKNQLLSNTFGHAYLFSGVRGTGKTSAAKVLARAVNCLQPKDGNPCNDCVICRGILSEEILDVVEMDAASNRGIENIRDLKERSVFQPAHTRFKVYIIDEVHMLTPEAFNALLKTLEEPPGHLLFILATTEPERLPATILSRCQRFDFRRLPHRLIMESLRKILADGGLKAEESALRLLATAADGSMRDALSLTDRCIAFADRGLTESAVREALGVSDGSLLQELTDAIADRRLGEMFSRMDALLMRGSEPSQLLREIAEEFRHALLAGTVSNAQDLLSMEAEQMAHYSELAERMGEARLLESLSLLLLREQDLRRSTQPRLLLELILALCTAERQALSEGQSMPKRQPEAARVLAKPRELPAASEVSAPLPVAASSTESKESSGVVKLEVEEIAKRWADYIRDISNPQIRILLEAGKPASFGGGRLIVVYPPERRFMLRLVSEKENVEIIRNAFQRFFKVPCEIRFEEAKKFEKERKVDLIHQYFENTEQ